MTKKVDDVSYVVNIVGTHFSHVFYIYIIFVAFVSVGGGLFWFLR